MLIGRDGERARLREVLADIRRGRGAAVVIRGEPGIGKTALLDDLRSAATGVRALSARGVESEASLAFAGLADVLRPVLDRRGALPPAQRTAIEAAMALGPPAVPDRFAAYAAALGLLEVVAAEAPLLVLVDDVHWLDVPSREALLFCARRLGDDPVAIVATSRRAPHDDLDIGGIDEIALGPLDEASSRRLLRAALPGADESLLRTLLDDAGGNPLALVELPRGLDEDERAGVRAPPRPPRAGEALVRSYRSLLARLPAPARRACLMVAISEDAGSSALDAALAREGGRREDLATAEAAGLVVIAGGTARMRHPVLRSVVRELATPAERRAAHRAIADALDPASDAEARAWHLAEATLGPDEEAAAALEQAAMAAAARTAYSAAAGALERAAALSRDPAAATARRLRATELAMAAGRPAWSLSLLEGARDGGAAATHLRGLVTLLAGDLDGAFRTLVEGARHEAARSPTAAAAMLADAVLTRTIAGDCHTALAVARQAFAIDPEGPTRVPSLVGYLAGTLVLRGQARAARPLLERFDVLTAEVDVTSPVGQMVVLSASWRGWLGDYEVTDARLDQWIDQGRASAAVGFLGFVLAFGCEMDFRLGRWGRARSRGEEALALLAETGQMGPSGYAAASLACVEGGLGLTDDARRRASETLEVAERLRVASAETYARAALGFASLGEGDPQRAVGDLARLEADTLRHGLAEPATVPWQPDLVEAYVRAGRVHDARRVLATLSEQAHRTGGVWALAVTHRCRGLIDDDLDRHFGEALRLHGRLPLPFDRARTELAYGARLRRAGRRTDARMHLERALAVFEDLGAQPWSRQAREEIAASGARLRPRAGGRPGEDLSPRELQIALAVAEGATNREVAGRLFLSEKTVERHLGSIYRKLGVRSRTELARHVATGALRR
ncbi:helix-turn-helix transcriptional regulator [Miltoncostaea oceani]|uniref:helix-turn-helix transcriptional regulator n=1 Tax=Miltoncostaea oceani TaxID=2843216 RepID=UPI001C3C3967|nr:LuxR family transcriptional regulator [Miltoncostaea oceani]